MEKTSEPDNGMENLTTTSGENDTSGAEEFQGGKDARFSTPSISTHFRFDEKIGTTGEFPILEDIHNNDSKILSLLSQETGTYYSFKGLMRKLNLHQQSLTRALVRLEQLGLVKRSEHGYKLNEIEQKSRTSVCGKPSAYSHLLQAYIPPGIEAKEIVRKLSGRWFSTVRWIGLIESETSYMLQWINQDNGFQINVRIIWDHIIIETNAVSDNDKIEAVVAAFKIFDQIVKLLQGRLQQHAVLN
ncbi:MAG TPA: MarR family transcriptional regulator [Candidatus Eisenbacteria bacterium]|nr:MarR family transcriptional regulator [Candidatus Eisenbacteria bacterium]